ncbi:RNA polymerase factor sigma-54 [Variovorax sp. KK3]|uniref:RNA polymerase factor sigma-54 n=1 Tax=Variovorax sp. KK3 TaxID=1855728 RepID=UPI00097C0AAB|nr:RNA polymerase factor sigma-54 [Variovorax sp. KK3]
MTVPALHARLTQAPIVSPWLQQAVRLLQLSALDYAKALQDSADANPFLEVDDAPLAGDGSQDDAAAPPQHVVERSAALPASQALGLDQLQNLPLADSLAAHLHAQLGVLRLSEDERSWAAAVVESLDEDGYLRISLADIAASVGWTPSAGEENEEGDEGDENVDDAEGVPAALRTALCRVQSLDPAGVGARSVPEGLRLQLRRQPESGTRTLALRVVADHIELLAAHNPRRLAAALGEPQAAVREAVDCIRRLDPHPGWRYGGTAARNIVPDVVAQRSGIAWTVHLNEAAMPRVRLHDACAGLYEAHRRNTRNTGTTGNSVATRADNDAGTELNAYLERARWTVQKLSQRRSTIQAVAQAIVERQHLFFDYGALAMKPLGLQEIADAVGVHASTVSRAVHEKFLATPFGVFELKYFFSRGLRHSGNSGKGGNNGKGACAPSAMKCLIASLVADEPPQAPLSDAELARRLAQQGFSIARRTVTKYRQELRLPAFEQRVAA